jgi:hypothetical protein
MCGKGFTAPLRFGPRTIAKRLVAFRQEPSESNVEESRPSGVLRLMQKKRIARAVLARSIGKTSMAKLCRSGLP